MLQLVVTFIDTILPLLNLSTKIREDIRNAAAAAATTTFMSLGPLSLLPDHYILYNDAYVNLTTRMLAKHYDTVKACQ